jgi:hypothetical protein
MATHSVSQYDYIRPYRGDVRLRNRPEAPSQTFPIGTPLITGADAGEEIQVKTAGSDPTTGILGFSAQAATGTEDENISFWLAEPGVEFVARVQDTGVLDYTNIGTAYGMVYDSTNDIWRVDLSDTTNVNVIVTALIDADGDVNGRVAFQVKASARSPFLG